MTVGVCEHTDKERERGHGATSAVLPPYPCAGKSLRRAPGKSLQSQNAMAVRPPTAGPAASAASEPATAESLGWQLRAALPPLRLHSVSLYDKDASVLWLSEGALGPDEHGLVLEAMEALATDTTQTVHENGMEDGRVAICLPVRTHPC